MNNKLQTAYEREHEWLDEADTLWADDMNGLGKDLITLARKSIALVALCETYQPEDLKACVEEWAELCVLLEEHEDDWVVVNKNPMGGWDIRDFFEADIELY